MNHQLNFTSYSHFTHLSFFQLENYKSKIKAFSLIELSVVLIIIGLLVAGITGGASLIFSAKNRAFANEVTGWKQAVLTFKAARGRYPGDIYNIGKFGYLSGYTYEKTDFAPPFDTGSFTPNDYSAPFVELYTEKVSDFKPTTNANCTGFPCSKNYPKIVFYYSYNSLTSSIPSDRLYHFRSDIVVLYIIYIDATQKINPKVAKALDEKIDDGAYNGGNLRFGCYKKVDGVDVDEGTTSYDDSINTKSVCYSGLYDLRLE